MGKPQHNTGFQTASYNTRTEAQAFQAEDIYNVLQHVSSNRRTMHPHIYGSSMFTRDIEGASGEYAQFYSREEEKYISEIDRDLKYLESLEASNPTESISTTSEAYSSDEWSLRTEAATSNITLTTQTRNTDLRSSSSRSSEHRYPRASSRRNNWV
ncbi:hypothetical protein TWF481_011513 [Arthrobotrys musiformis]|uniref:Uncharacterized protein n=1 Tax=Arthrobotrys musiformis TaxID=47236 RepID=A0AAV9VZN9_9PEZI